MKRRDITNICKRHNCSKYRLARLAHVGVRSLERYENLEPLKFEIKRRIQLAVMTLEDYDVGFWDNPPGDPSIRAMIAEHNDALERLLQRQIDRLILLEID